MRRLVRLLLRWPTDAALRLACVVGLLAMALMVAGVLSGAVLPVMAAMTVAQGLGLAAGLLYAATLAAETLKHRSKPPP